MEQDSKTRAPEDASLPQIFVDDIRRTEWRRDYRQEFRDLYRFYLDDERRTRLANMGRLRRAFSLLGWTLKSLLMKLSPARRLLLLAALVFMILGNPSVQLAEYTLQADLRPWGFLLLLVVLMLELKDKLLARDEIEVARQVQIALLPLTHPEIPGWEIWSYSRPANDVGGDLVDYIEVDEMRHAVVLGDVAGKGLGAALLSAKLQATLRALLPESTGLEELGLRVNVIFHRDGIDNRYATLFLAQLEHDSGQLRYLNAGHNPPFVIRPDSVEKLPASSFPLGMLGSAAYEEGRTSLEPGDLMLIYSDGLTEATDADGEEFGMERLERMLPGLRDLPPDEVGARVLSAVEAFLGEERNGDDLSVAVIVRS